MENQKQDTLYKWLALLVVVIGTFMAILDTSIVNVAIPKMMAVFGVSTDQIFTINIPVGIMGVALAALLLKESPRRPAKKFDYLGFLTCTIGLVSILYVLGEGSSVDPRLKESLCIVKNDYVAGLLKDVDPIEIDNIIHSLNQLNSLMEGHKS